MRPAKLTRKTAMKALLALILLASLAGVAGLQLAPNVPLHWVLLYSAGGAVAVFFALGIGTVITLTFSQFILRKGGTDVQWFCFPTEPPGLARLRAHALDSEAQSKKG